MWWRVAIANVAAKADVCMAHGDQECWSKELIFAVQLVRFNTPTAYGVGENDREALRPC